VANSAECELQWLKYTPISARMMGFILKLHCYLHQITISSDQQNVKLGKMGNLVANKLQ